MIKYKNFGEQRDHSAISWSGNGLPSWAPAAAIIPALLATILLFVDQHITALIVNRKDNKLKVSQTNNHAVISKRGCLLIVYNENEYERKIILFYFFPLCRKGQATILIYSSLVVLSSSTLPLVCRGLLEPPLSQFPTSSLSTSTPPALPQEKGQSSSESGD